MSDDATGTGTVDPARLAESEAALAELLRDEILGRSDRRVPFARYMQRALTEPDVGYYATSTSRPTREGDFLTAPELHPFFGRCVARQLAALWREAGSPDAFTVREYGAGRGTLADAIRDGLAFDHPALAATLTSEPFDLPTASHAAPPIVGVILANEFLDALPVHRVVRRGDRLREIHTTWRDGWFADAEADLSTHAIADQLAAGGIELADGQVADVCLELEPWIRRWAGELERGWLLVIDYGHEAETLYGPRRMAGTLLGYRGHRVEPDPYRAVGRTDLTAHVDVTTLRRAADAAGFALRLSTTQGPWLAGLGLGDLLSELGRSPATDPQTYLDARAAVARLVDPRHLGSFRVLLWERDGVADR